MARLTGEKWIADGRRSARSRKWLRRKACEPRSACITVNGCADSPMALRCAGAAGAVNGWAGWQGGVGEGRWPGKGRGGTTGVGRGVGGLRRWRVASRRPGSLRSPVAHFLPADGDGVARGRRPRRAHGARSQRPWMGAVPMDGRRSRSDRDALNGCDADGPGGRKWLVCRLARALNGCADGRSAREAMP